ncbi:MAG TPA: hypothetical protein VMD09_12775 [Solirubrobacteraceae bacterium]|nr:hypothetical protein [Solirubrobacteraceae bacterium]
MSAPELYCDGLPEYGSAGYAALTPAQQLAVAEYRAGLPGADVGDLLPDVGVVSTARTRPYSSQDPISNPIDSW